MRLWELEGGAWERGLQVGAPEEGVQQPVPGPGCKRQVARSEAVVWGSCRSLKFARNFWKFHSNPAPVQ